MDGAVEIIGIGGPDHDMDLALQVMAQAWPLGLDPVADIIIVPPIGRDLRIDCARHPIEERRRRPVRAARREGPVEGSQLAAVPAGGWQNRYGSARVLGIWGAGAAVSLAIAALLYLRQLQLRRLQMRDAELSLAASVIDSLNEAIMVTDARGRVVTVNPAFSALTGIDESAASGRPASAVVSCPYSEESRNEFADQLERDGYWRGELDDRRASGESYPKSLSIYPVREPGGRIAHYVHSFSDISERREAERKIHHLAHHDMLTGLPNRLSLQLRMEQVMAHARRHGTLFAVLMIDMDHFKDINDTLGHHVGDALLVEVGKRLQRCVRQSDVVARLGGDEFVVLVTDMVTTLTAAAVAEKIVAALSAPYAVEAYQLHSTPSVGIGVFPNDGETVDDLLRNVDSAMYHAKAAGRNNYQFFNDSMSANASERLTLQSSLHQAIAKRQFVLHYQPQIETGSGRLMGVEVLVRWEHPERGLVPPNKFIPIAEESDLIIRLGEWILQEACRQLSVWRAMGLQMRIAVNLSARQLRSKNLLRQVKDVVLKYDLKPGDLELEITESVAMEDADNTLRMLAQLRELGLELAIDDFGTGYSSLSHLKLMPLQRLKIDRSFVKDIENDPDDAAICAATISLAHNLGLTVIAEGVETEAQVAFLKKSHCDEFQGYYFAKPIPLATLKQYLQQRAKDRLPAAESAAESSTQTLLLLDDEENILRALTRVLRRDGYHVLTANRAQDAFALLAKHEVQVILSDQRMPEMNGTAFFSRVKDLYPDTIRIVLSGYTDLTSVTEAINQGAIYKFLTKPWDDAQLRATVAQAFQHHELAQPKEDNPTPQDNPAPGKD